MTSIIQAEIQFSGEIWNFVSIEAKDLIQNLLEKDSSQRLTAKEVLDHPWIINTQSSYKFLSPSQLKGSNNVTNLEDFFVKALAINRAFEVDDTFEKEFTTVAMDIPDRKIAKSIDLSQTNHLNYGRRRKGNKEIFSKFSAIEEIESDFFMDNL